jgi:hypothetical protein
LTVVAPVLLALLLKLPLPFAIAIGVASAVFLVFLVMPFQSCERFARARLRRGECGVCGQRLNGSEYDPRNCCLD